MIASCENCEWFRPDSNPNILFGSCDGINTDEPDVGAKELIYAFADDPYVATIINVHKSFYCKNHKRNHA